MAYAALISLKHTLKNILQHPQRYSIPCEKKDIESFHEKLGFLQRFLEEYPSHERNGNANVTFLEGRIRDAAYGAEDFMDLHLNNPSHDPEGSSSYLIKAINHVIHLAAAFKNDTCDLNEEEEMRRTHFKLMVKEVDSLIAEVMKVEEQMGLEIKQGRGSFMLEEATEIGKVRDHEDLETRDGSRQDPSKLVGFEDHLMEIKDQLADEQSTLKILSIVGMGGIGKTTLATNVYNDPYVVNHFDVCAWATVSQSYSVRDILLGMLDSMKTLAKEMLEESDAQLRLHVYKYLKGRRYLIAIDDIWDTKAWDGLKMMFPDENNGSRIMLTTRIANVAAYASPSGTPHRINPLKDEQSWMLLRAKVFGEEPCPLSLQEIGKKIANNCGGLPLSIVVAGGFLSKVEKTRTAWQSVAANIASSRADGCSDILRLSYDYLPQKLKTCFLYMGVFPKSYEIRVSKLTKMWVAEGFLKEVDGQSPEDAAERCVEDLFDRSLISISKKNFEGKIKAFGIHDLLLDFCLEEAKSEKFLQVTRSRGGLFPPGLASERRISIHPMRKFKHILIPYDFVSCTPYIRSFICVGQCFVGSSMFSEFKQLRVLDVAQVEFLEFPPKVLELQNLRYIAMIYQWAIPASITKLWNLQTLIIVKRRLDQISITYLPAEIWNIAHLRHVKCDGAQLPDPTTAKFSSSGENLVLKDLQTLTGLRNLIFTEEMLQSIPNIKKIDVVYESPRLKKWSDYQIENLGCLLHLEALKIRVLHPFGIKLFSTWPRFYVHLPPSLKTLTLGGVGIPWHDLTIIGSLPNLKVLKLMDDACLGTEWEPNEEEFSKLKVLVLGRVKLRHWRADSNHFPSLERLVIRRCDELVEIPSGLGESATLATIELGGCKDSVLDSANEIMERQRSYGNDSFRVISGKRSSERDLAEKVIQAFYRPPRFLISTKNQIDEKSRV